MANSNYTKNKSLYTTKTFHKKIGDSVIYENDILTIIPNDGLFNDEMSLYSDSNFKYQIRIDDNSKKKHVKSSWVSPNSGSTDNIWTLNNIASETHSEESKIVTKPNYSSLRDFAYYGSAVELIRGTVNDMILRFPGGLSYYGPNNAIEIRDSITDVTYYLVSNEFKIDCWSANVSPDTLSNPMRVLSSSYTNYEDKDGKKITKPTITISGACPCSVIGSTTIAGENLLIYLTSEGDNCLVTTDKNKTDVIIKPTQEYITKFWDTLDDFERVLLNRDSYPIYKASFETPFITDEGYFYDVKDYIWPTIDGFTLDITTGAFQFYLQSLLTLAEFHDSYDSDNIWRMMTHESIKNLDWTFTNNNGEIIDDTINLDSGRLEKLIHIQGRIYDDIKRNVGNIKASNSISYDGKNNTPDYFLSDVVENNGWEAKSVSNFGITTDSAITYGSGATNAVLFVSGKTDSFINSTFQRRLALSSNYINSMKGTRRGIEAILGMFGYKKNEDYEIKEYIVSAQTALNYCDFVKLKSSFSYINSEETSEYEYLKDYPVAIRIPDDNTSFNGWEIIPWNNSSKTYLDSNFYFQSKGGWGKSRERYINRTDLTNLHNISGNTLYDETEPYMLYVTNIDDMLSIPINRLFNNIVCYVEDINSLTNGKYDYLDDKESVNFSHYFILGNTAFSTILGIFSGTCNGWINVRVEEYANSNTLTASGSKILYLESIITKERGNNPHTGKGNYDDGIEYFNYFKQIFKPDIDNGKYKTADFVSQEAIKVSGFTLTNLLEDNKKCIIVDESDIDTDLIMNTKHLTIKFNTSNEEAKKYIKETVLMYLNEMIPSTTIVEFLFSDDKESLFNKINDVNVKIAQMDVIDDTDSTIFWREDDSFLNK